MKQGGFGLLQKILLVSSQLFGFQSIIKNVSRETFFG
jgi:hypothetical protein